ncbi:MAG: DEAD/DEAH box helicase [Desulfuromonadaceae bacterium]|nr:DEAD/DEAH box helicase [Desulfuromonadaceae bacterium]
MSSTVSFADLSLPAPLLRALQELGHDVPTPIQAEAIPLLFEGRDLIGQAQTGTGKTAAFALPLLARLEKGGRSPQVLVLTPTRELALQVCGAFQEYGKHLAGVHSLAVYGGQGYEVQLRGLKRGAQIVIGTPGRILDHLDRGALKLDSLRAFILDEGDEMLRMGFIEDVERIIGAAPPECQKALFSATMPAPILRIARNHLREPALVRIASRTATVESIDQRYFLLRTEQKPEALVRLLEMEDHEGVLVFTRTKTATVEVADHLKNAGFSATALNGDMNQPLRESAVGRLRNGELKIVVATDVAARGLDVDRISMVVNYDIPQDAEPYVHRIGRTGRAGREGKAYLFVTPTERRFLKAIEQVTGQTITAARVPSSGELERKRGERFRERLGRIREEQSLEYYQAFVDRLTQEMNLSAAELAPVLLYLAQSEQPLRVEKSSLDIHLLPPSPARGGEKRKGFDAAGSGRSVLRKKGVVRRPAGASRFDRYRLEVGKKHNVKVGDIVGAIVNEGEIAGGSIGHICLYDDYSTVELPEGMPKAVFHHLKKVFVRRRKLNPSLING